MRKFKVLNLYACLGGNRYKWDEVAAEAGIELEVTAVELDPELARLYQERFPNDKVIVADAHAYLLDHYQEFSEGMVWSSPPCPTHSRARFWAHGSTGASPVYPDIKLYQEILFLEHHFKGKYVVENVVPYYTPLLPAQERDRHLYWTNFKLPNDLKARHFDGMCQGKNEVDRLSKFHDYDFRKYKGSQLLNKIARNLVDYEAGRTIFETALNITRANNVKQNSLF
jgi:DNA (cytosine-5)-methyltransferase 1